MRTSHWFVRKTLVRLHDARLPKKIKAKKQLNIELKHYILTAKEYFLYLSLIYLYVAFPFCAFRCFTLRFLLTKIRRCKGVESGFVPQYQTALLHKLIEHNKNKKNNQDILTQGLR